MGSAVRPVWQDDWDLLLEATHRHMGVTSTRNIYAMEELLGIDHFTKWMKDYTKKDEYGRLLPPGGIFPEEIRAKVQSLMGENGHTIFKAMQAKRGT